jgi:hypothetical protein
VGAAETDAGSLPFTGYPLTGLILAALLLLLCVLLLRIGFAVHDRIRGAHAS